MANLETLELTINANAESASKGLDRLINSLSGLSNKVGKTVSGLKILNAELKQLQQASGLSFKKFSEALSSGKAVRNIRKATEQMKQSVEVPDTKLDALQMKYRGVTNAMEKAAKKGNELSVANRRLQQFSIEKQISAETDALKNQADVVKEAVEVPETKVQALEMKLADVTEAMDKAASSGNRLGVANKRLQQLSIEKQIEKETGAIKERERAMEKLKDYDWGNNRAVNKGSPDAKSEEEWKADYKAKGEAIKAQREARQAEVKMWRLQHAIKNNPVVKYLNEAKQASHYVQDYINQSMGIGNAPKSAAESASVFMEQMKSSTPIAERAKNAFGKFKEGLGNLRKELGESIPKFTLLNKVMRVASTMLIRMGIRALFKGAKEGLDNYYQYAKATNGAFAKGMDDIASSWAQIKNQMGAAIAPALSAALPVLNALASAATTAFNALSQLFALLSGQNTWSKATAQVKDYGDSINKANGGGGGGLKEMLANFDELNVIASEGGGGSGAATAAENFKNMFEEIGEFDEKIRDIANFVKQTIEWIKENFDTLLATAGLIGLAILGWKMSKNFEGALGQLGRYIAGGALIAVGVVLEYDFGKKVGAALAGGKGLEWEDIFEGIAGFIAAGLGGYLIGGGLGAVIGVGIALVAFITGVMVGYSDQIDKNKWGNETLTQEQIKEYVKNRFTFDVDAEIKIADLHISNSRAARAHLDRTIWEFGESLRKIKLGVDTSDVAFEDAIEKFNEFKTKFDEWATNSENLLTAHFQLMPYDEETETGIKTDVFEANKELKKYFEDAGKEMARLFDEGMRSGWENGEKEQILALMDHIDAITNGANEIYENEKLKLGTKALLGNFTRDTAESILAEQKKQLEEHYTKLKAMNQEAADNILMQAAYAEAAGMTDMAEKLKKDAEKLVNGFESSYTEKLSGSKEIMKNEWIQSLKSVYGEDVIKKFIDMGGYGGTKYIDGLKDSMRKGTDDAKEYINNLLALMVSRVSPIAADASELFGFSGWDLLEDREKQNFFNYTYQAIKGEAIPLLKSALNISVDEMLRISGWTDMEKTQKFEFLTMIAKSYGGQEALNAAKSAGFDVGVAIQSGLISSDEKQRQAAQELLNAMNATFKNGKLVIPDVQKPQGFFERAMQTARDKINQMASIIKNSPLVTSPIKVDESTKNAESSVNSVFKNLQNWVKSFSVTIPVTASSDTSGAYGVISSMASSLQSSVSSYLKVTIPVGVKSDGSSVSTTVHDTKTGGKYVGLSNNPGYVFANGGFPMMGSVFIAGEAGAEMVGTINGRTGVANTDQIVEGIAQGVSNANSEQNALLRQQNELLRGILAKDASVRIGASAALGRVAKQSLDMYGSLVGG